MYGKFEVRNADTVTVEIERLVGDREGDAAVGGGTWS
jgi:hypothetical protein